MQFWGLGLGFGEPQAVLALHIIGTAELMEDLLVLDGIVEKGTSIQGFGAKVKEIEAAQRSLILLDKAKLLKGEEEARRGEG